MQPMDIHTTRRTPRPIAAICILLAIVATLCIGSSAASAAPAERTIVHETFDMDFGDTCHFPLLAHAEMKVTLKTFLDAPGCRFEAS